MGTYCRGLKPVNQDRYFMIKFSDVFNTEFLPTPPPLPFGFGQKVPVLGMLGNDSVGNCVMAGANHEHQVTNAAAGHPVAFDTAHCKQDYFALTGGTDSGLDIDAAAKWRISTGVQDATGKRHKVDTYIQLNHNDPIQLRAAIATFGAIGLGWDLSDDQEQQFDSGKPWALTSAKPNGWHYTACTDVNHDDMLVCITWGRLQGIMPSFLNARCNAAVAYLNLDFLNKLNLTPQGYDAPRLRAMIAERQGQ